MIKKEEKTIEYKKSDWVKRLADEKWQKQFGWIKIKEEEYKRFNGGKSCLLFVLFPPLALLGQSKYIKVTYERTTQK